MQNNALNIASPQPENRFDTTVQKTRAYTKRNQKHKYILTCPSQLQMPMNWTQGTADTE